MRGGARGDPDAPDGADASDGLDHAPGSAGADASDPHAPAAADGARPSRVGLLFIAFASGFAVLTLELAGARLIAPVFGLSAVPWTAVIGVILAALAAGSHWGGRLADAGRVPLSAILAAAGLCGALPVVGSGIPWAARQLLGFIPGALASALILFAPAVFCLGAVVPYLVRADTESLGTVGRRAGDVSAAATAGSIAGTFTTGFFLLPALPLAALLGVAAAGLLALAAVAGRLLGDAPVGPRRSTAAALALIALGWLVSGRSADTLHAEQTLYAAVSVTERVWADGRTVRELWQNGGSSSAEYVETGEPAHAYAKASLEILDEVLLRTRKALVLGGAALTLPVAFERARPGLEIDVVELDPVVTALAARYFAYGERDRPSIRVIHQDGRVFLRTSRDAYDLVYLDVFDHLLTVPWTMVTQEALSAMAARLTSDGVFAANVLSPLAGPGAEFLERFQATLSEAFAAVRVYRASPEADLEVTQNVVVVAAHEGAALPDVARAIAPVPSRGRPLTDAWAPVEYLQAKVFVQGLVWE